MAGADLLAGVDRDSQALETHARNLPGDHIEHDLRDVDPTILPGVDRLPQTHIDWVHGSPPCQGFTKVQGDRDPNDERNNLVWDFVEWVDVLQPKVVTMENVTGMATIEETFIDRLRTAFHEAGYNVRIKELNAADYGVPQTRKRVFVVGVREDLELPSRWVPKPTHAETPTTTLDGRTLEEWRTVREAIGDLADVREGDCLTPQQNEPHMLAGRRPLPTVDEPAHTIRTGTTPAILPQELPLPDGGVLDAGKPSSDMELNPLVTADATELPNHDPKPDEDRRLGKAAEYPAVTVTSRAQLQARNVGGQLPMTERDIRRLTPRESARLQSFPDWFVFEGDKRDVLQQIGNAVPPRLAQHLTAHIRTLLETV